MAFPETRHSILEAARSADEATRARGMEALAEAYWRPVYVHLRLTWRKDDADARDLTQELFAKLVEKRWLDGYDPGKAKLRTFLRVCVDGLVSNENRAASRQKRGGGAPLLSLDFEDARAAVERAGAATRETPDELFEKEWRRTVLTRAVERLRARCVAGGIAVRFAIFEARELSGEEPPPSYEALAARFGVKATDVTNHLSFCRRELKRTALEILGEGAASDDEARRDAREIFGA